MQFGFWAALVLHGLTGLWILPTLQGMASGVVGLVIAWPLDAIASAGLIYLLDFMIAAVSLPAMKACTAKDEFRRAV